MLAGPERLCVVVGVIVPHVNGLLQASGLGVRARPRQGIHIHTSRTQQQQQQDALRWPFLSMACVCPPREIDKANRDVSWESSRRWPRNEPSPELEGPTSGRR